jgi:hypothetical protein
VVSCCKFPDAEPSWFDGKEKSITYEDTITAVTGFFTARKI